MALHWIAPEYGGIDVLELVEVEVSPPGPGEVTIDVRAAGMNPIDGKVIAGTYNRDPHALPILLGNEVSGVVAAIGDGAVLASGGGAPGDEVIAYPVSGGYASQLNVAAQNVFAKPQTLGFAEAANLLLVGATASDMLHVTDVSEGETVLIHGASGGVGTSAVQQARLRGARVIGTASERNFDLLEKLGAEPVAYGPGLADRVRGLAPDGVDAALDTVGTDEAVDVSLELVADRHRIVTIAAGARAQEDGFQLVGGRNPASADYRAGVRGTLIQLAGDGKLVVPMGRTFPLTEAPEALRLLQTGHPGGKLALIP
jgi:NADPH:quinone reductase-like Zn-dependent oxidoreductase